MSDSKASETRLPLDPALFSDIDGDDDDVRNGAPIDAAVSNSNKELLGSPLSENPNLEDASSSQNPFQAHDSGSSEDHLDDLQDQNNDQTEHALSVNSETPRVYVAPRIMISHQDSFSDDYRADNRNDDATKSSGSPRAVMSNSNDNVMEDSQNEGMEDVGLPRLRVPGSPRALVYQRTVGSPSRFGSPRAVVSPMSTGTAQDAAGMIDTAAPFESVKEVVSKFGGITDWKAHKIQTIERRKYVDQELEKIQEDIPEYKKKAEVAEEAKQQVVKELENTKKLMEELKLDLEKAQKEEQQAKQDSELAKLRVEELEQGIADEASVAAKAQLEVAKARQSSAVSELTFVKEELETVHKEYDALLKEKDLAVKKAEAAMMESKETEKKVEGLTIELIATKELLESAHTEHLEAEEKKFSAAMARDQNIYNWEKELKLVEEDIERLNQEIQSTHDAKSKLETASALLNDLRAELAAYMEKTKSSAESTGDFRMEKRSHSDIQAAIESAKNELEEVKSNIESATYEVNGLKVTASTLQSELEKERSNLAEAKQRNTELEQMSSVQVKDKEEREEVAEVPEKLQQAAKEADEAKSLAKAAREELNKAKEESDQAKAEVTKIETKLVEAKKEMEAAKASEKLALSAIKALQESESTQRSEDVNSPRSVIISVEEYYELSKQAHEAEEAANTKLAEIVSQVEAAKEEESRSVEKLEEVNREMTKRKEELKVAMEKAEKARGGKLDVEQELRKWRAENGERRKAGEEPEKSPRASVEKRDQENSLSQLKDVPLGSYTPRPMTTSGDGGSNDGSNSDPATAPAPETKKKKKKFSLLPKVFMFLSRKKSNK